MSEAENFGSFFRENKQLAKDYIDARLEIFRLGLIRILSKSAGYLIWVILSLFLFFLFLIFAGLVLGFWMSSLTGSYVAGFGITTGILLLVIVLLALFRRQLFVNPIIRMVINLAAPANDEEEISE